MKFVPPTIPTLFVERVALSGDALALDEWDGVTGTTVHAMSWGQWHARSLDLATALVAAGDDVGTSLGILAANRLLWPVAEIGGAMAGMVTVGVYPTASAAQLRELLLDAGVVTLVVDSKDQLDKVREATRGWERTILVIADVPAECLRDDDGAVHEESWEQFLAFGHQLRLAESVATSEVRRRAAAVTGDDVAMLIYTSGSTGEPKGARLSHRCVVESARSVRDTLALTADDSSLSFLPYCHAGERLFGLYTRILCGMPATLVSDVSTLWDAQRAVQPTLFGGMPRFFEKVYEGLLSARGALAPAEGERWDRAVAAGRARARLRLAGEPVPVALESQWREDVTAITPVLARSFGTRLRLATSGGAALPLEVAEYLDACGVTVLGAYGQTEHLCAAFNRPARYRHDSVGVAMPGTTIRIADDGEVQLQRSALTFAGYHRRPEESRAAFTDDGEWLRTGDLGLLDADGFLRITGRIKELIALSNGKKVAPLALETRLVAGDLIAHAVVYGEGRPYLVALFALRWTLVEQWQRARGLVATRRELVAHPALVAAVHEEVARANAAVSRPEQVRRFAILPHDLSVEADELTATLKVRRATVTDRYRALLDSLYSEVA
ncbi:MAG: AMP-dependent synthetase/ligase [Gemmatimonadaceae bacterium]